MADNKRYYWLKLKDDFFTDKKIKKLRNIAGGDTYTIIYLKMQLLSLKNKGILYFDEIEDTFEEEIALEIDENVDDVKVCIMYLLKCGLMEMKDNDEYSMIQTQELIGSETSSTIRSRKSRKIKSEREKMLQCNTNATQVQHKCNGDIYIDIDIDKEIDIDIEKEKDIEKENKEKDEIGHLSLKCPTKIEIEKDNIYCLANQDKIPYQDIVNYLNSRIGSNYKYTTNKTQTLIRTRFKEGFNYDDFIKVIDNMYNEWFFDKQMKPYLRPETLFGNKFESYLNRPIRNKTTKDIYNDFDWSEF